jgi:hypothetical protein
MMDRMKSFIQILYFIKVNVVYKGTNEIKKKTTKIKSIVFFFLFLFFLIYRFNQYLFAVNICSQEPNT